MMTSYTGVAGSTIERWRGGYDGVLQRYGQHRQRRGMLFANSQVKLTDITDGTSNTIMVAEMSDHLRDANNQPIPGSFTAITSQGPHGWTMGCATSASGAVNIRQFDCHHGAVVDRSAARTR
jgi:hypothetical protein